MVVTEYGASEGEWRMNTNGPAKEATRTAGNATQLPRQNAVTRAPNVITDMSKSYTKSGK